MDIIPGWETNCNSFTHGELFGYWLNNYEDNAKRVFHDMMKTTFDYESNMTEHNKNKKVQLLTCIQGSPNYTIDVWDLSVEFVENDVLILIVTVPMWN